MKQKPYTIKKKYYVTLEDEDLTYIYPTPFEVERDRLVSDIEEEANWLSITIDKIIGKKLSKALHRHKIKKILRKARIYIDTDELIKILLGGKHEWKNGYQKGYEDAEKKYKSIGITVEDLLHSFSAAPKKISFFYSCAIELGEQSGDYDEIICDFGEWIVRDFLYDSIKEQLTMYIVLL